MDKLLQDILAAREERLQMRQEIAASGKPSLSLTMNIPGVPKSTPLYHSFFIHVLQELKRYLVSYRIPVEFNKELVTIDSDGDFFLVPLGEGLRDLKELKCLTEKFESSHPLGRLLDVDLVDSEGNPVSSGIAKTCFFCNDQPAIVCMRQQRHSYQEMRAIVDEEIGAFLHQQHGEVVCRRLSALALKALLHEVSLSPKPGLVDRFDSGSHRDMDYATFLDSAAVISSYFKDIAEYGFQFEGENLKEALPKLRQLGLQMEEAMFAETIGVNTHKGAIFLLGFSLFTTAYLIAGCRYSEKEFVQCIRTMNGDLVAKELGKKLYDQGKTHGEECYERYGDRGRGIRGEIQNGMPAVFKHALPVLRSVIGDRERESDALLHNALTQTLLAIMAYNDDSNILYRKGLSVLEELKSLSAIALNQQGGCQENADFEKLIKFCEEHHISPGGSADLLAVSLFIFWVEREYSEYPLL
jgi:holo-ACP synthase/triphosphoribosyl-dephospho-CoA synthase